MPMLFDFYCPKCDYEYEDYWLYNGEDFPNCPHCHTEMRNAIRCKSFELKYNPKTDMCSWADQGYSSSMYWSEVKKARDRGEKVKGALEN